MCLFLCNEVWYHAAAHGVIGRVLFHRQWINPGPPTAWVIRKRKNVPTWYKGIPSKHQDIGPTSIRRATRQLDLTSVRRRADVICSSAQRRFDVGPMRRGVGPTYGPRRRPDISALRHVDVGAMRRTYVGPLLGRQANDVGSTSH